MSHEGVIVLQVGSGEGQVEFSVSAPTMWEQVEGDQGISLALSRRLVELHGGRLRVEQREGATVLSFALPVNASRRSPSEERGVAAETYESSAE